MTETTTFLGKSIAFSRNLRPFCFKGPETRKFPEKSRINQKPARNEIMP